MVLPFLIVLCTVARVIWHSHASHYIHPAQNFFIASPSACQIKSKLMVSLSASSNLTSIFHGIHSALYVIGANLIQSILWVEWMSFPRSENYLGNIFIVMLMFFFFFSYFLVNWSKIFLQTPRISKLFYLHWNLKNLCTWFIYISNLPFPA